MFEYVANELEQVFWRMTEEVYQGNYLELTHAPFDFGLAIASTLPKYLTTFSPYYYEEGLAPLKEPGNSFTILSFNIFAMHGCVPEVLDGIRPWRDRIDGIVKLFLDADADILCLQEVHDVACAYSLMEELKYEYAHFYYNIGPCALGYNSGLFVASKFPINEPRFERFHERKGDQWWVNKGFFSFSIGDITIVNTHLQPREEDWEPRASQFSQINADVIVGDLNIKYGSKEWETYQFEGHGFDTCTENFLNEVAIDYILTDLKKEVQCIETYSNENPREALSDHKAILALIHLEK